VRFRSEFFHVPGKIELQGIQSAANIAALLFWQGFQLLSRLFFDLKPVTHRRIAAIDYCPCPANPRRLLIGKIVSTRAPLQRTRSDGQAFKPARLGPHTAGKLSAPQSAISLPRRTEPQGCERHRWVKPRGRNERERVSQSVRGRTWFCLPIHASTV
jgi:hypothetical protein